MYLLVVFEMLGGFVQTLSVDDSSFLCTSENLSQPIQVQLSEKRKTFSQFIAAFVKLH